MRSKDPSALWRHSIWLLLACSCGDPATRMIHRMDRSPPDQRPPNWEHTRALMSRPAPAVGDLASDFTIKSRDGKSAITRSTFQAGRPLVLVFGSFT